MDALELLLNMEPRKLPEKDYRIKSLSAEAGKPVVFRLRALPFSRVAEIRQVDGESQSVHIILAGVASPDLRSPALMEKYGAATPADMLKAMLLPGEIDDLAIRVEQLSGYRSTVTEEVKKNSDPTRSSG